MSTTSTVSADSSSRPCGRSAPRASSRSVAAPELLGEVRPKLFRRHVVELVDRLNLAAVNEHHEQFSSNQLRGLYRRCCLPVVPRELAVVEQHLNNRLPA